MTAIRNVNNRRFAAQRSRPAPEFGNGARYSTLPAEVIAEVEKTN